MDCAQIAEPSMMLRSTSPYRSARGGGVLTIVPSDAFEWAWRRRYLPRSTDGTRVGGGVGGSVGPRGPAGSGLRPQGEQAAAAAIPLRGRPTLSEQGGAGQFGPDLADKNVLVHPVLGTVEETAFTGAVGGGVPGTGPDRVGTGALGRAHQVGETVPARGRGPGVSPPGARAVGEGGPALDGEPVVAGGVAGELLRGVGCGETCRAHGQPLCPQTSDPRQAGR